MARLTVSQIRADESVPRELIKQYDTLQPVNDTPLAIWVRETFEVFRRAGLQDGMILVIIKANAKDKGYSVAKCLMNYSRML